MADQIKADQRPKLGNIGWHTLRAWLGSFGTPLGIQQNLIRHASITTNMNISTAGRCRNR
jgi:integrase